METMTEASYEELVQMLTDCNVALTDVNGEYRSTYDIMSDIAAQWENMTSMEQAALATALSGTRQQAVFFSIIEQFQEASGAMDAMADSAGALDEAYSVYMESTTAHINQFKAAFQELSSNIFNSELLKFFIDIGTGIVNVINTLEQLHLLLPMIVASIVLIKGIGISKTLTESTAKVATLTASLISEKAATDALATSVASLTTAEKLKLATNIQSAVASGQLTAQEGAQILSTLGLATAEGTLTVANTSLAASFKSLMASIPVWGWIALGISVVIEAVTALTSAASQSKSELAEVAEEVTNTYNQEKSSLESTKEALDEISGRYAELSKGVNSLGKNVSLSTDEYDEYKDIVSQVADMFPTMIQGYNDEGLAILTCKGDVEELTAAYQALVKAANDAVLADATDLFKDFQNSRDDFEDSNFKGNKLTDNAIEALENILNSENLDDAITQYAKTGSTNMVQIVQALKDAGIEQNGGTWYKLWTDGETGHDFIKRAIQENRTVVESIVGNFETQMSDATDGMQTIVSAYISNAFIGAYSDMSPLLQSVISNVTSGYDYDFYTQFDSLNDLYDYLSDLLNQFHGLSNNDTEVLTTAFNLETSYNNGECTLGEYIDGLNRAKEIISGFDEDTQKAFNVLLNLDDDGITEQYNTLLSKLGSGNKGWLDSLSADELELVYQISLDCDTAKWELSDWQSKLEEYQLAAEAVAESTKVSFSELLAEEDTDSEDSFKTKVDDYIDKVTELQEALESYRDGDFTNEDLISLIEDFPELASESDNLVEAIENQIKELTGYEKTVDSAGNTVEEATGIMAVFDEAFGRVDSDEDVAALQAFMGAVLELGEVVGNTAFSIDIDAETEGMENLWTAMKESVSSTGLTAESISNLKARYQDLENYDAAKLFEKTANGVHLNTKALRELEAEYESTKKAQIDADLEDLVEQYNDLTEQINNADDAASTADLYAQRSKILEQIEDTTLLAAQYEGLTSAFYKWEQAQSIGEEGDMYDSLAGSLEDIKELYDEGLIGTNKFRTAVQLMSNEDLSTASVDELLAAYEAGYSKMTRYFTDSSDGCLNFLNDIQKLNSEWVKLNDDGSWDINFGLGNDQEIADALGINVESIQAIMRKLSDYGFDINLDSIYSNLDLLQTYAEKANDALKELGSTDYTFNFNTTDLEYATEQIEVAQSLLDQFKNDDGTVNLELDGAEEAQTILVALITNKQTLSAPAIMSIDTTALDEADAEIGEALQLLQEFVSYSNDLEIDTALGVDTTETQQKIQDVATKLSELPDETKVAIGIDGEDFSSQLQSIVDADVDVEAGVSINQTDIDSVISTIGSINPETIELQTNADAINAELTAIDEYTIDDKDFSVTVHDYASTKLQNINSYVRSLPSNKSITVTTYTKTVSASKASGTAHADGTAMADGYWGVKNPEPSLGGEVGQELVVRNGRFFTIGDDSAEIFHPQKDDIIFNADQTEQIFKYGKIKSGAKRGRTFASGTAYSSGSGKITVGGSVITKPTGGGSSGGSSSSGSSSSDEDDTEIIDWIEIAIDRIERAINNLSTVAKSAFRTLSEKLTATNDEISEMTYEMSVQQSAYARYMQEANSVGLSSNLAAKVQNGTIDINEYDSDTADLIKSYQEWYEKALDCSDAILELSESIAELYQNKFDDVASDYENQLSLLEHLTNTYNNGIEDLEERGYLASTKYYTALQNVEKQNIAIQKKELAALTAAMSEAVNSGSIAEGSQAWYEMQQEINSVTEAIQESEMALVEYANAIRDIEWERFDYIQEQISNITEEADFLIDLLDNSDLYTDNGQLTDIGMAAMGLHGQNYNVYMAQADKYAEELLALNEEIANDPNNITLLERREELLEAQRDCILAAEDEKQAIVDMVKEGIELELAALQELITSYTDALDSAKDLYDYQKKIKDQTSEIASLQKQLAAYSGDTSEETRATIQKIQVDLADAMEDLEETQYEHYISEQKKMLDNLYDEYEMILNQRLDDVDALISDMIDMINVNSASISDTISAQSEAVGYTLSESMKEIWTNEGGAYSIITKYGESFTGQFTSINNVLNAISTNVAAMVAASEATATSTVDSTSESTPTTGTQGSSGGGTSTPKPPASDNTSSNKYSEAVKQGVAAAIWIYGGSKSGWGNNPERKKRLTEKFGSANASAIQGYINAHGSNGDLYKYWVNSGKSALSQYYYSAFKKGGLADYTGMAWLDGTPTEPEMVLNSEDTANFIALKDAMRSVANGDSPLAALFGVDGSSSQVLEKLAQLDSPAARAATTIGDITYEITIPIDHVSDYEDFMNQLRKDGKFEKFIQSITLDRITGGSKLAKNRYQW